MEVSTNNVVAITLNASWEYKLSPRERLVERVCLDMF